MSDVAVGSLKNSSSGQDKPEVFNLSDERSIVSLLRYIHQSLLSPDEKNELRDTVFTFKKNKKGKLTSGLIANFKAYGISVISVVAEGLEDAIVPETLPAIPTKINVSPMGTSRPRPSFIVVPALPKEDQKTDTLVQEATQKKAPQLNTPVQATIQNNVVEEPLVPEVVSDTVLKPNNTTSVQTPGTPPSTIPVPQIPPIKEETLKANFPERIKEIKREVNSLVGNPVNLIDKHSEIGREYMNALLDAMKKNNAGTAKQVSDAINRLEHSFAAVKTAVENDVHTSTEKPVKSVPVPTQETEPTAPRPKERQDIPVPVREVKSIAVPVMSKPLSVMEPVVQSKQTPQNPPVGSLPSKTAIISNPHTITSVDTTSIQDTVSTSKNVSATPPIPQASHQIQSDTPTAKKSEKTHSTKNITRGIMSVAKEKQIEDLMFAKKQEAVTIDQQKEKTKIASMDPLMTPDVTSGLHQLLSEWDLFKSSGIFGTGPSGEDHPLYKKLAPLNISAVAAGRFEGATHHIQQSITSYMSGWRYEEGILKTHGELFEHYLRRVVKHILDKNSVDSTKK